VCKKEFRPNAPLQKVCDYKCAIELVKKVKEVKELSEWKVRKKKLREATKKLSEYKKEAREVFQAWIRKRDEELPCISCGTTYSDPWQGSHYFKAEIFKGLIFNEMNCHKSCLQCNFFLDGNELGYREGLVKRYGEQYVKDLEALKDGSRNYKYSKSELIEIKDKYKRKLKEL
jgi:hypothetical protein